MFHKTYLTSCLTSKPAYPFSAFIALLRILLMLHQPGGAQAYRKNAAPEANVSPTCPIRYQKIYPLATPSCPFPKQMWPRLETVSLSRSSAGPSVCFVRLRRTFASSLQRAHHEDRFLNPWTAPDIRVTGCRLAAAPQARPLPETVGAARSLLGRLAVEPRRN